MSSSSVTFGNGRIIIDVPDVAGDTIIAEALKGYRKLLVDGIDVEAEHYMRTKTLEDFRIANVHNSLIYLNAIDKVLEWLGEPHAK